MTLQLQPGTWYRQRDGGKAYVAAELPKEAVPIDLAGFSMLGTDDRGGTELWRPDGRFDDLGKESHLDLVAEWVDEPTDAEIAEAVRWYMGFEDKVGLKFCTCIRKTPRDFVDAVNEYREREGA